MEFECELAINLHTKTSGETLRIGLVRAADPTGLHTKCLFSPVTHRVPLSRWPETLESQGKRAQIMPTRTIHLENPGRRRHLGVIRTCAYYRDRLDDPLSLRLMLVAHCGIEPSRGADVGVAQQPHDRVHRKMVDPVVPVRLAKAVDRECPIGRQPDLAHMPSDLIEAH